LRIGIDTLAIQSPYSRGRGIGRYARGLLAALLDLDRDNDYVILVYEDLEREAIPTSPKTSFREIRRRPDQGEHTLQHAIERFLREGANDLDWYLLLSPFETWEFFGAPAKPWNGPRMAAVLYDLIPFLDQETYLCDDDVGQWFYGHLERLARYDQILCISEATRRDAQRLLGLADTRLHVIGSASEPPTPAEHTELVLERFGIDRPFVFCLGGSDPRKNLSGLLDAFAMLPERLQGALQLVISCAFSEVEEHRVLERARERGIEDKLVLTNAVTDQELRVFYETCAVFVFPSLYEGFGLPILEAMQNGAAVIASNNSSQPEVLGEAGLLANSEDPRALGLSIERMLNDPALSNRAREQGREQAKSFQWSDVAQRTIRRLKSRPEPRSCVSSRRRRPRIAVFSPLPPIRSGIADYTVRLLDGLKDDYLIDLYHDPSYVPDRSLGSDNQIGTFEASLFERRRATIPYQATLYQVGNSTHHHYIYKALVNNPGYMTLHDMALGGLHTGYDLAQGAQGQHLLNEAEFEGAAARRLTMELVQGWQPGRWELPDALTRHGVYLHRRALERSKRILVHSDFAARTIRHRFPWLGGRLQVIRFPCVPAPTSPFSRKLARDELGFDPNQQLIGLFGIRHFTKMTCEIIEAFAQVADRHPFAHLVIVGEELDHGEAEQVAQQHGIESRLRFTGRVDELTYSRWLRAVDLTLSLRRHPSNGETSASLMDGLARGLPTIIGRVGSYKELPDDVVFKIGTTDQSPRVDEIVHAMITLLENESMRHALSFRSLQYVQRAHSWENFIDAYRDLCQSAS